jgi:hypothetical protein
MAVGLQQQAAVEAHLTSPDRSSANKRQRSDGDLLLVCLKNGFESGVSWSDCSSLRVARSLVIDPSEVKSSNKIF